MCGINGFTWYDKKIIQKMNYVTRLRGPDDEGTYLDQSVSLGHSRLAIIDLSPKGHQPMISRENSLVITYNGEIYNFQQIRRELEQAGVSFTSNSDTEVILEAYRKYGIDCLQQFNGMWAFCLYDIEKKKLILSRDRFGVKPLFYYIDENNLIFSSMISSILAHPIPTAPNQRAVMEYLAFNLLHYSSHTFFENIYSLLPGNILSFDLETRKHQIITWYQPKTRQIYDIAQLRQCFIESVQLRTVSDVPIGSCLSGGVDSSAIVCVLDKILQEPFSTYSLVVPDSNLDESKYILEVGKYTKAQLHFTEIHAQEFIDDLQDFILCHEEPAPGLSLYAQYIVFKIAHQNGAKVLLDGQGGDELFAGYVYYFGYYFYELFASLRWLILLKEIYMTFTKKKKIFPFLMFLFLLLPDFVSYQLWKRLQTKHINHKYLHQVCPQGKDPRWDKMSVRESLKLTQFVTSIPHLLRWEDRNSMRWSIESRTPFMDYRLFEMSLSIPTESLIKDGETKIIFKEALADLLPAVIRERKDKVGFEAPEDELFRDPKVVQYMKDIVYSESFKKRAYWKWNDIEKIFTSHTSGKTNAGNILWKCINIELWLNLFFKETTS